MKYSILRIFIYVTSVLFVVACGQADQPAAAIQSGSPSPDGAAAAASMPPTETPKADTVLTPGATVEGISEYSLPNGLKVILFPDDSAEKTTVNVTYFVGSRHEAYGETGMAHLLEHLVFRGSSKHPDIDAEFVERGATWNGTTWVDRTNYFETFPSSEENLTWALDLEADRMVNSFIRKEDLDSEMTVVRNELESGENSPFRILLQRLLSVAFDWHNYGNSTIGARADLENVPIERLQGFYRKYYQPDNAMLVVAGRFDREKTLQTIGAKFGAIPRPDRTGEMEIFPTYTRESPQDGRREVVLKRVGDVQYLMSAYHAPPGPHEDFAAIEVLANILGREPTGRLYKNLVESGEASSAGAFAWRFAEPGVLVNFVEVRKGDSLSQARETLFATINGLKDNPPTEQEVERARNQLIKNLERVYKDSQFFALSMSEWAANGDWRLFFIHRDRIKSITEADVARVVNQYLLESNVSVAEFHPVDETPPRAEIPAAPDIAALVSDYQSDEQMAEGEQFDPSPENIQQRTTVVTFDNGFKLAMLPKKNRGETVTATLNLRFGDEQSLQGWMQDADLVSNILMRGTQQRSREQIQDDLDRMKSSMSMGGDVNSMSASIQSERQYFVDVLRLLGEVLREPAFDEKEWALLKEETLANMEGQKSEPRALAPIALERHVNPQSQGHPSYSPTIDEWITMYAAADLARAKQFYADFYGATGGTMAIVGDFDPDQLLPVLKEVFADWTPRQPYARIPRPHVDVEPLRDAIETPDKANAMMMAKLNLPLRDSSADYAEMLMANYMLGGAGLHARLPRKIRTEEGLSYGVGSWLRAHGLDERGEFGSYAIFAPENGDKVQSTYLDVITNTLESGFETEEFETAKSGYLERRKVGRAQDGAIAGLLNGNLFYDRDMGYTIDLENEIATLELDQVNAALRKYVDPERISIVVAGDFEGAEQAEADEAGD